jgi:hypothetical protein
VQRGQVPTGVGLAQHEVDLAIVKRVEGLVEVVVGMLAHLEAGAVEHRLGDRSALDADALAAQVGGHHDRALATVEERRGRLDVGAGDGDAVGVVGAAVHDDVALGAQRGAIDHGHVAHLEAQLAGERGA